MTMTILELYPYDLNLVSPAVVAATRDLWARLPELTAGPPTARLLLLSAAFNEEHVLAGFRRHAVPEAGLPGLVRAYRALFEDHIRQTTATTRYLRLFLVLAARQPDDVLARLLAGYGLRARPLADPIPLPFGAIDDRWTRGDDEGRRWALLRSARQQTGQLHLRYLHPLFALGFPLWASLDVETLPKGQALQMLRRKTTSARLERRADLEARATASDVQQTAQLLRKEIQHAGMALHHFRLNILVGALNEGQLRERLHLVRSACGLALQEWESPVAETRKMFAPTPPARVDGSLVSTRGLVAAAGSPLVYRRRTATGGVLLGVDRHHAPVIVNLFDESHPSYNAVILGQTGSGKTFAFQLLALRHMLLGCRVIMVDPQGNIDWSFLGDDVCQTVPLGTAGSTLNVLDVTHDELPVQVENVLSRLKLLEVYGDGPGDSLARTILDRQLTGMYEAIWENRRATPAMATPTLPHLQRRLEALAGSEGESAVGQAARAMSYRLSRYTQGSQAGLFGGPSTVDLSLSHPVTVFDISKLPDPETEGNLRAALLSILVGGVSQAIKRLRQSDHPAAGTPIIWFIDEMGVLMRDPVIAANTSYEFKTARARLVSMVVADQDLHSLLGRRDAAGTHHGVPMLANAAVVALFHQRQGQREAIEAAFPELPPSLAETIYHQELGQCVLQLPGDVVGLTVRPSEFEKVLLSSRLQDRARRQQVVARLRRYLQDDE